MGRPGFNTRTSDAEEEAPQGHGCAAYGCPLPGTMSDSGGTWVCPYHQAAPAGVWQQITAYLRQHEGLLVYMDKLRHTAWVDDQAFREGRHVLAPLSHYPQAPRPLDQEGPRRFVRRMEEWFRKQVQARQDELVQAHSRRESQAEGAGQADHVAWAINSLSAQVSPGGHSRETV